MDVYDVYRVFTGRNVKTVLSNTIYIDTSSEDSEILEVLWNCGVLEERGGDEPMEVMMAFSPNLKSATIFIDCQITHILVKTVSKH